jgi:hypothetical protein
MCLLQETHSSIELEDKCRREWNGHIEYCHGTSNSKGVAILFPSSYDVIVSNTHVYPEGRYLVLDVCIDKERMLIINVYAPTKDKEREQMILLDRLQEIYRGKSRNANYIGGRFQHLP